MQTRAGPVSGSPVHPYAKRQRILHFAKEGDLFWRPDNLGQRLIAKNKSELFLKLSRAGPDNGTVKRKLDRKEDRLDTSGAERKR